MCTVLLTSLFDQAETGFCRAESFLSGLQGNTIVVGRKSPHSLYNEKIASFEDDEGLYDQKDAAGFIKLQVSFCLHVKPLQPVDLRFAKI